MGKPVRIRREYGEKWYGYIAKVDSGGRIKVRTGRIEWYTSADMIEHSDKDNIGQLYKKVIDGEDTSSDEEEKEEGDKSKK